MSRNTKLRELLQKWSACEIGLEEIESELVELLIDRGKPVFEQFLRMDESTPLDEILSLFDPSVRGNPFLLAITAHSHAISAGSVIHSARGMELEVKFLPR